jgi:rubrerythrin
MSLIPAPTPPPPVRRGYICTACSYGVSVVRPPARCPMCGDKAWTLDPRRLVNGT